MESKKTILITGAAGNLGGLLAKHLAAGDVNLHLFIHKKDAAPELAMLPNIRIFRGDLARKESLQEALQGVDVVIHFAGILFKAKPEKFLPTTNTGYFKNLAEAAADARVKRIILISFPHVEGETTPENPATGLLNGHPNSVHARTRLEEEKYLFTQCYKWGIEGVSLRVGMVYGRGILMIDAARWASKHHLLGIWKKPTSIHLISTIDFLNATKNAILNNHVSGVYHLGDEGMVTLQEFFDEACAHWNTHRPWRMPVWMIFTAARLCELWSAVFYTRSPLTVDFIRIGMTSYYGDTSRMRQELLPKLTYPTFREGIDTL